MNPKSTLLHLLLAAGSSLLAVSHVHAASGTWDTDADGDWTTVTNWSGDAAFASGTGFIATLGDFITADHTINLDTPITIGNITASDTSHNYTISGANTLTLDVSSGQSNINVTTSGRNLTISSVLAGADGLSKTGLGTLTLSGSNAITGATLISGGGKLVLDYTTNDNRKLPNNSTLSLAAGTIVLKGGTATENFTSTTFNTGTNGTFLVRDTGTAKLNLNAFTVGTGSAVSFSHDSLATTDRLNVAGIMGAWFTVGNRWATNGGVGGADTTGAGASADGDIVGYTGGTTFTPAVATNFDINYDLAGSATLTGSRTVNTLRIESTGDDQVLNLGANNIQTSNLTGTNALTGTSGGLLYAGGANGNYTITGTTGRLLIENQNGQGQLINVYNGTLTVDAVVGSGSSPLVKSGEGTLVLKKDNAYGTSLRVYQGVVRLDHNNALETPSTVQNGAAIELSNGISVGAFASTITGTGISNGGALRSLATTTASFAGAITLGTGGARINSDSTGTLTLTGGIDTNGNTVTFGGAGNTTVSTVGISDAGGLIKDGAGSTTLSATNTYSGATSINAGTLVITGATQGTSAITFGGGVLGLDTATPVTAASATVDFTGQSVLVTGPTGDPSYPLLTASSITGTPALAVAVPGYTLQVVSNELRLVQTGGDLTPPSLTSIADDVSGGPVVVNTPVTYTVTFNEDMNDATVSSADFSNAGTSTISFGTITETSPGVFSVPVTPTTAGTLILQIPVGASLADVAGNLLDNDPALVDDTTITVQTQYEAWAGGAAFGDDANGDGVSNGLAFLLGAGGPNDNALGLLPTVTQSSGNLILNFKCLNTAKRGSAVLKVQYSKDLGITDLWDSHFGDSAVVPGTAPTTVTVGGVDFDSTVFDADKNNMQATIPASAASPGTKLFGRLKAEQP